MLITLAVLAAAAVPAFALAAPAKTGLEAYLSNTAEVPKSAAKASGEADVTISGTSVCWKFKNLKGAAGAVAAHIHKAPKGKAGPVVVALGTTFKLAGCTKAAAAIAAAIAKTPGAYYVNVHTRAHPAGALRGQLHEED
jgi:Cu/Zn superoxide dismutase